MLKKIGLTSLFILLCLSSQTFSQNQQLLTSQQFRLGERIIRIAEPGQLVDSVNVWGDVGSAGRYLVPKGTRLTDIVSYSFGPRTFSETQTQIDWSEMRVEINVQSFDKATGESKIDKFRYRFEEPYPEGMADFIVSNNQTVSVRVKRKAAFRDYLSIITPVISAIGTAVTAIVLITDRN